MLKLNAICRQLCITGDLLC